MSEIRKDIFDNSWVIFSTNRGDRPNDYLNGNVNCPFCPGHEMETPQEIISIKNKKGKWTIRVVPNRYPAVSKNNLINDSRIEGIYNALSAYGVHEVVIESEKHNALFEEMEIEKIEEILKIYAFRYKELYKVPGVKYVMVFKNVGMNAGASLRHPHSQIIALPLVPKSVISELNSSKKFFKRNNKCLFCEIIEQEKKFKKRVVYENKNFMVFCPFSSKFCYETWIIPKNHFSDFQNFRDYKQLAEIMKITMKALKRTFIDLSYNMIIHSSPKENSAFYHWHIEILPKLANMAGFEWGSGFYINIIEPEKAAEKLKKNIII
jgi:UDPglucose--hexose-1-phosphate uridylyltransferase